MKMLSESRRGVSCSATMTGSWSQGMASAEGSTMLSATRTGMKSKTLASTKRELHGVHPDGLRQRTAHVGVGVSRGG